MKFKEIDESRRGFLKGALAAAAIAGPETMLAGYTPFKPDSLQVGRAEDCPKHLTS